MLTKLTLRVFVLQVVCATLLMAHGSMAQHPDKVRVTLALQDVTFQQALKELEKRTPFTFHYNDQEIDASVHVSAKVVDQSVSSVLNPWLRKLGAKFVTVGTNIVIKPLPPRVRTGALIGTVTDAATGEPLVGASVAVGGARWGAMTDAGGNFKIDKIDEGVYTVAVSYIGYNATQVNDVQIQAGTSTRINVRLNAASSSLEEVVVTAKTDVILENSSDMSVLREMRLANNVVTGISNQQISRSMDRDAAEVVRRATGVTLADDRFAMVRGFDPRYTLTLLNDFPAPSVESDRSAFSFDLINSANLDRVMIYKMPSAELPGNQAGGIIKIYTKNSANANQFNFQLSTQYRPGSSFQEYYTYQGGKYDRLGFDDGTRAIPKNIPSPQEFPQPELGVPEKNAPNAVICRAFPNNWNLQKANSNLDKRAVLSYYANVPLGKMGTLNSLSSVTYTQTTNINEVNRKFGYQQYDSLGINLARVGNKPVDAYNSAIQEVSAVEGMRLTGMQNFKWTINERHAIAWKNLFNQQATDRVNLRDERAGADEAAIYARTVWRRVVYKFQARTLYSGVLSGDHQLTPTLAVHWRGGVGYGADQQPDFRSLRFATADPLPGYEIPDQLGSQKTYSYVVSDTQLQTDNFRGYNDLHENTWSGMLDVSKTFPRDIVWRLGGFYEQRARKFINRMFGYAYATYSGVSSPTLFENANSLFNQADFKNDGTGVRLFDMSGMQQASPQNNLYRYEAENRQQAGYTSINVPLWHNRIMIYGGVRIERNHFNYPGTFAVIQGNKLVDITIDQTKTWVLPSAMVTYKPGDKHTVRLSYGKSLNRPEFRESAPIKVTDLDRNVVNEGNYSLVPAEIHNLDLRWEFYPAHADELLSAGVYYKSITNAIEPYSNSNSGFTQDYIIPQNTPETKGYGVEVEARKRLDFLPGKLFQHLALNANVTLLRTEVNIQKVLEQGGTDYRDLRRPVRPMVNASPYAVNASLYYDNKGTGTQWTILYNALGQRLATAGTSYTAELYIMPRSTVDISFTQSLTGHTRLRLGVQDIFNQPIRTYRDRDRSKTYNPDTLAKIGSNGYQSLYVRDYMEEEYKPGTYWSIGFLFSL